MTSTTPVASGAKTPGRITAWLRARLVPLAIANLCANILLVVTGGVVRLTSSGLGCPTWPKCTDGSYVKHGATGIHGVIEFSNRMLTYVLTAIAIAVVIAAWKHVGRVRRSRSASPWASRCRP